MAVAVNEKVLLLLNANQAMGVCNELSVPVPSQDKLGGLRRKGIRRKNGGLMEVDC